MDRDWSYDSMNLDPSTTIMNVNTTRQLEDKVTNGKYTRHNWVQLFQLSNVMTHDTCANSLLNVASTPYGVLLFLICQRELSTISLEIIKSARNQIRCEHSPKKKARQNVYEINRALPQLDLRAVDRHVRDDPNHQTTDTSEHSVTELKTDRCKRRLDALDN